MANLAWFFDFVVAPGWVELYTNETDPVHQNIALKETLIEKTHAIKFNESRHPDLKNFPKPPLASVNDPGVGYAIECVYKQAGIVFPGPRTDATTDATADATADATTAGA